MVVRRRARGLRGLDDGTVLQWQLEEPEEDPGYYWLGFEADNGDAVSALVAGPAVTGDPRTLDLVPSVEDLSALVRDDRLRLRATKDVVRAGEDLDDWDGGEVDPDDLAEARHTDASLAGGWAYAYGDDWTYEGPSPLRAEWGPDAVGGRLRVGREFMPVGPGTIDVLAPPEPPAWLASGDCLPEMTCHRFQGATFAFRPAEGEDPGEAWIINTWPNGEAVALHTRGRRLPAGWRDAAAEAGAWMWTTDVTDEASVTRLAFTTTAEGKATGEREAQVHAAP